MNIAKTFNKILNVVTNRVRWHENEFFLNFSF